MHRESVNLQNRAPPKERVLTIHVPVCLVCSVHHIARESAYPNSYFNIVPHKIRKKGRKRELTGTFYTDLSHVELKKKSVL